VTVQLRPYQSAAIEAVRKQLAAGKRRVVLVAPTGAGKTVMFSAMVARAVSNGKRALILVHRRELVDQALDKLRAVGIDAGVILAGVPPRPELPVQVASVQTLGAARNGVRCRELPPADLVVVDEAHHAVSPTWLRLIKAYAAAIIIGVTATPWRTDKRGLADIFEAHVVAATVAELIANGSLSPYEAYAYDAPDLHDVPVVAGEFNQGALSLACNTSVLVGGIVREYLSYGRGRSALLFAVSIEHSLALVDELRAHGVPAEHVDGSTPKPERAAILRRLAAGETHVVSNVGCFTEGFDSPGVEICILARPTMSLSLHLQMCGRGLRPAPGKQRALLVDHGGNFLRHGLPDDERDYSLTATPKRVEEMHRCPLCCAVFGRLGDDGSCPKCGEIIAPPREVREEQARREKERIEGERIEAERIRELRRQHAANVPTEQKRKFYDRLCAEAASKRYKKGWVYVRFKLAFGHPPNFGKAA
jgi:DNA repair protein RadD